MAARARWPGAKIVALDRPKIRARARALGLADQDAPLGHLAREAARCAPHDLIVLALPVETTARLLAAWPRPDSVRGPLLLDTCSVKAPVLAAAAGLARFVGGHPMAGRERGGIDHADRHLLTDRTFALCPSDDTSPAALRRARALVTELGARPLVLDAADHDRATAWTSHVPHVLAHALLAGTASGAPTRPRGMPWALAAGSFRDATRVAAASPSAWDEILRGNAAEVERALGELSERIDAVRLALRSGAPHPLDAASPGAGARATARLRLRLARLLPPLRAP